MNEFSPHNLSPEELANRLDDILSSKNNDSLVPGSQADPRIQTAIRLAKTQHPQMSPDTASRVQARVMRANRQQQARRKQTQSRRFWHPKYAFTSRLIATFAIVSIFFGAALFPTLASSVPGDFWYPFKRNLEDIELSLATSASARANVYLTQAERRVAEAQIILQRQVFDKSLMLDANQNLANYEHLASEITPSSTDTDLRAASVTESIALLMQEAEYQQTISGNQVLALLPTVLPIPTTAASSTPIPTATDVPPTTLPTLEAVESQVVGMTSDSGSTDASPTVVATSTLWPTATSQLPTLTMYALENANVRSEPSRDQAVITVLRQGTSTEIIGDDNTGKWWHVRLKNGESGWVAKFLLSVNKPTVPPGTNGSSGNNNVNDDGSNSSNGSNDGSNSSSNSNFGCDHSGNYCNAPGYNQNSGSQGQSNNQSNGNSSSNSGNGHKP